MITKIKDLKVSMKVSLDIQELNDQLPVLTKGYIRISEPNYYDLIVQGELVCCDGEECIIVEIKKDKIILKNIEGEHPHIFSLTKEEIKIGATLV